MTNRTRLLCVILLTAVTLAAPALRRADSATRPDKQPRVLRCTKAALARLIPTPKLDYDCGGIEQDKKSLKHPERLAALKDFLEQLETTFNNADWWATPVEELNACSIANEARALSQDESREYAFNISLYGDQSTRLVAITDPCIQYSYRTLNAYVLQRAGDRVVATQVLDGFYTRFDAALDIDIAQLNGERLIIVDRVAFDGLGASVTMIGNAYTINPRTHRPVPKKIFKENGKLTNAFSWDAPPFVDVNQQPLEADGWRPPEIVRNGKLAARFRVDYPTRRGLRHDTYVWNGQYYAYQR